MENVDHGMRTARPLSSRRLSNIEQYKARAAQKRQERIKGGGVATQSTFSKPTLPSAIPNAGQPIPASKYANPLAGMGDPLARGSRGGSLGAASRPPLSKVENAHPRGPVGGRVPDAAARDRAGTAPSGTRWMDDLNARAGPPSGAAREAAAAPRARALTTGPAHPASSAAAPSNVFGDVRAHTQSLLSGNTAAQKLQSQGLVSVYEPEGARRPAARAPYADTRLSHEPAPVPAEARASEQQRRNPSQASVGVGADVSGLDFSSDAARRVSLMRPGPRAGYVQCTIRRIRGTMGRYPKYVLSQDRTGDVMAAARKRKKSKSSNYIISLNDSDLSRDSDAFFGKLRSNFVGTEFVIFDAGLKPPPGVNKSKSQEIKDARGGGTDGTVDASDVRSELGAVLYETNVLGTRGPRKMTVLVPRVGGGGSASPEGAGSTLRASFKPDGGSESMLELHKKGQRDARFQVYHNKSPDWNEQLGAYCLNFNGRVTEASVKNFQLVEGDEGEEIVLQFGKVDDNEFTMDFKYPMCALQAFGICLSSFDGKLACE